MQLATYRKHQNFFNEKAASWKIPNNHIAFTRHLESQIRFNGNETVLDVGCGTGNLFPFLQKHVTVGKVIGLDFAFNMLQRSVEKLRAQDIAIQAMAEVLPIRSSSVDIVINYCLYPHLKYKQTALQEFYRILKEEGRYFILHPQGSYEVNCIHRDIGEPVCYDYIESVESVVAFLELNGFSVYNAIDQQDMFFIDAVKTG